MTSSTWSCKRVLVWVSVPSTSRRSSGVVTSWMRSYPLTCVGASPHNVYLLRCIWCTTSSRLPNMPMLASAARSLLKTPYATFARQDLSIYHCPFYHPAFFVYLGRQVQDRARRHRMSTYTHTLSSSLLATGCTSRVLPKESSLSISLSSTICC